MPEAIPADVHVDVVIAKSLQHLGERAAPFVAIFPDSDNWNDYGRNFFAKLHIHPTEGDPLKLHLRMMFQGRPWSEPVFNELLQKFGDVFPIEQITTPFVALLTKGDYYRQVIEALGFNVGVSALRKMHDATVARTERTNEQLLALIDDEDFHIGALRSDSAYDALRRGSRYFRQNLPKVVEDAAIDFAFSANLPSADNPYTLTFRFNRDGIFHDRAAVLIGRNGVGKTQLLKSIVDGLHSKHQEGYLRPHFQPSFQPSRVIVFSSVPTDPFPRSIGAWHGIDYEYFAVNASREDHADPLLAALVACRKTEERIGFGEHGFNTRMDVIQGALEPLGLWRRLHLPLRARQEGIALPYVIEPDGQRYFPIWRSLNEFNSIRLIQQIDWSRPAIVLDAHMEVRSLSSGEYAMLRFAAQASAAIEQGSLLLLDEPETHLHPNFVSDLMEILDNLLQSTRSIAIIATHSAYVVRETPRERVNVLTLKDRTISIDTPRMQTFGATIDSISQFVFGDTSISHRYQKTLTDWADQIGRDMGIEGVIAQYGAELNSESLSFIARRLAEPLPASPEPEQPEAI
ncbi:AAA family ATPase [Methylobacterium sp. 37f]|uniref:AAA family ATPase n=1 Tax=Methylobacterium sp. 37f TaxID=2817058 RepID=UPI001FFD5561|nr:AAA family ATPase [Methylobacterium sp. 37f]MCK2053806.1 AAA family ATPase [Methylobacterium sp. 37f]